MKKNTDKKKENFKSMLRKKGELCCRAGRGHQKCFRTEKFISVQICF